MDENYDNEVVASEHDRLVNAITKLDKTQHIAKPTRNEPTSTNSEFNLVKRSNKIKLNHVAKVLEDTAHHVQIGQKLRNVQKSSKILEKPLEKPQAERVKRAAGYQQTKTKLGRWDPVVARNRTVDFVSFPIKTFPTKLQPTSDFLTKFKLKSPLEKELEAIDPPAENEDHEEEEQQYPISYEEMLLHRQTLAKLRAQQSYKAAKAKRQSKIKSKKYHRILKKEKLQQQVKEFEELQNKNPEEALKKLEELEKARALERHTLRHKNTGKWAKSKLVRAKYDKEVRQQLTEQLSVSRGLTHKTQIPESSDEDDNEGNIPDVTLNKDPMNPWMLKRSDKQNIDADFNFGYKKYLKDKIIQRDESDSDSDHGKLTEENKELAVPKEDIKRKINKVELSKLKKQSKQSSKKLSGLKSHQKKIPLVTSTSSWFVEPINNDQGIISQEITSAFETYESNIANKVEKKLNKLRTELDKLDKRRVSKEKLNSNKIKKKKHDNIEYLKLKNQKEKAIIDEALIETATKEIPTLSENVTINQALNKAQEIDKSKEIITEINPYVFTKVEPKYLNTVLPSGDNEVDDLDDEQVVPRVDFEGVFEDDDVAATFRQEKEDEENKDKPENIDSALPGWGSWGGKGVKAPKRKHNRFISKPAPKFRRRDENKGDIIINEYKDPNLQTHRVSDLPFPFTSVKDYEASIRAPIGNTFITEEAHRKLIKPAVITKVGAIIEPMDEDELLVPRNQNYKNDRVLKMLGKK